MRRCDRLLWPAALALVLSEGTVQAGFILRIPKPAFLHAALPSSLPLLVAVPVFAADLRSGDFRVVLGAGAFREVTEGAAQAATDRPTDAAAESPQQLASRLLETATEGAGVTLSPGWTFALHGPPTGGNEPPPSLLALPGGPGAGPAEARRGKQGFREVLHEIDPELAALLRVSPPSAGARNLVDLRSGPARPDWEVTPTQRGSGREGDGYRGWAVEAVAQVLSFVFQWRWVILPVLVLFLLLISQMKGPPSGS